MTRDAREDDQGDGRGSVVVTGTSSGIGAATVSRLAILGFHVFAGVRCEEDAEAVRIGLTTCMPVRSYLHSRAAKAVLGGTPFAAVSVSRRYYKGNLGDIRKLGERAGGSWVGGTHFVADGNQVSSMASWLVFMRKNEPRSRYFDVRLPRPNLKVDFAEQARSFAHELADRASSSSAAEPERERDATR